MAWAIHSRTVSTNSSVVMPACVAIPRAATPFIPVAIAVLKSPARIDLNGSVLRHSGCFGASVFTRSHMKNTWTGSGISHHNVPSLSKTATRSLTGTYSALPAVDTRVTKSSIDCLAWHSFQEGSGSERL